jgi:hypothetical protein
MMKINRVRVWQNFLGCHAQENVGRFGKSPYKFSFLLVHRRPMGNSYENNEPQRRRERKEKKNLCESVSSVDKFSFILVSAPLMGNSYENRSESRVSSQSSSEFLRVPWLSLPLVNPIH